MPRLFLFGGPNGAGKTTIAMGILRTLCVRHFVNPEAIAAGLSPFYPELAYWKAGRLAVERVRELTNRGEDFGLESTLSGQKVLGCVQHCLEQGYSLQTFQVRLADPQLAVARVGTRSSIGIGGVAVANGRIAKDKILHDYERGRFTFSSLYRGLSDEWMLFENSAANGHDLKVVTPKPLNPHTESIMLSAKLAVDDAVDFRRRMGQTVVTWENNQVRWLLPNEIELPPFSIEVQTQNGNDAH